MRCFILFLIVPVLVIAEPSCTAVKTHVKTYNQGQPLDTVHSKALDELRDIARDATSNPDLDPFGSESPLHRMPSFTMKLEEIDAYNKNTEVSENFKQLIVGFILNNYRNNDLLRRIRQS